MRIVNLIASFLALTCDFRLLALTTEMHARLPLELRNAIYNELLHDEVMDSLNFQADAWMDDYPKDIFHREEDMSAPIDIEAMHPEIAAELIRALHIKHDKLGTHRSSSVGKKLSTDYFGLGVRPSDVAIPAFTAWLDMRVEKAALIGQNFAPLLGLQQKWTKGFKLNITLYCDVLDSGLDFGQYVRVTRFDRNIYRCAQALRPIYSAAQARGATVKIIVEKQVGWYDTNCVDVSEKLDLDYSAWTKMIIESEREFLRGLKDFPITFVEM